MTTKTISVTGNTQTLSGDIFFDTSVIKGRGEINFDFTELDTSDDQILRATIDYGDGSDLVYKTFGIGLDHETQPITYYYALYGAYSPLLIQTHLYDPPIGDTYFNSLTAKFYVELSDTRTINFYFPIKVAQPSYYDELDRIEISSTQLVSVSTNDIFCAINNRDNNIISMILY